MAELLRHRQTKGAATDMFSLQLPRHIPTLPEADLEAFGRECLLLGGSGHQARVFRCDADGC
jgi:hypothetical protein